MKDILLVEDNLELAELIQAFLVKEGYSVVHVASGEEALLYLEDGQVKIVILDVMLTGMDGFAVCSILRRRGNLPVLMLSARAGKEDKLNGFDLGADDYIEKPVDPELLCARIRALLQRSYGNRTQSDILYAGQLTADRNSRKVYRKEEELQLNAKEYELLLLFMENPGKTLHKEYLFDRIWGADSFSENQTLTVHIKMLRTKIEEDPRHPRLIQTVWGVGYRYEEI